MNVQNYVACNFHRGANVDKPSALSHYLLQWLLCKLFVHTNTREGNFGILWLKRKFVCSHKTWKMYEEINFPYTYKQYIFAWSSLDWTRYTVDFSFTPRNNHFYWGDRIRINQSIVVLGVCLMTYLNNCRDVITDIFRWGKAIGWAFLLIRPLNW